MTHPSDRKRIPLAEPNLGPGEAANLQACIEDGFVSSVGRFVVDFETGVAAASGVGHGVALGAGTQALHMALHVAGVRPGDLVILPAFTFIASANAIAHCGAQPWLFDISPDSWTIDAAQVEAALERRTARRGNDLVHTGTGRRVAAIMPVYTLGQPADMDELAALGARYGLALIADAAAAIGARYRDRPLGSLADITCYSFNGNKTLTCGGGGAAVSADSAMVDRIRHVSSTARVSRDYLHDEIGWNYRMTNLQAAVGCAQLARLDNFLNAKRRIRRGYDTAFEGFADLQAFPQPSDRSSTCWFSGIVLPRSGPAPALICEMLATLNIEARPFWRPIHQQPPYREAPCETLSVTDLLWDRILTLPCSTHLSDEDVSLVADAVRDALNTHGVS